MTLKEAIKVIEAGGRVSHRTWDVKHTYLDAGKDDKSGRVVLSRAVKNYATGEWFTSGPSREKFPKDGYCFAEDEFYTAIRLANKGYKVRRKCWREGSYIYSERHPPLISGRQVQNTLWFVINEFDCVAYAPQPTDLTADDWQIVEYLGEAD